MLFIFSERTSFLRLMLSIWIRETIYRINSTDTWLSHQWLFRLRDYFKSSHVSILLTWYATGGIEVHIKLQCMWTEQSLKRKKTELSEVTISVRTVVIRDINWLHSETSAQQELYKHHCYNRLIEKGSNFESLLWYYSRFSDSAVCTIFLLTL